MFRLMNKQMLLIEQNLKFANLKLETSISKRGVYQIDAGNRGVDDDLLGRFKSFVKCLTGWITT
jgi:hypothetical protein